MSETAYQFQDGDFHLTLVQVCRLVLDHLDSEQLVRSHVLTLDDLPKSTLTKNIQDQIPKDQLLPLHSCQKLTYHLPVHHLGHR
jgi:hypothetical protein